MKTHKHKYISGGVEIRTPVTTSDLIILKFLLVELVVVDTSPLLLVGNINITHTFSLLFSLLNDTHSFSS